jgi:hypothetical protein
LIDNLEEETIELLQRIIHQGNPYSQTLMTAYEQYGDEEIQNVVVAVRSERQDRRYDVQSYPEVAALVREHTTDGSFHPHDILINDRRSGLKKISSLHASYMPLHYVLMFPYGDDGWYEGMMSGRTLPGASQPLEISLRDYCAYMLMVRDNYFIQHYNRLFQQYVVDCYVRIEAARLQYFSLNQNEIRADLYNGIEDGADPRQVGRNIILPSSFQDGPRFMRQALQDSLAIVRSRGKPTLFITMTCNPRWPEIIAAIPRGQSPYDRPDICSRVFHIKMKDLIKNVIEKKCFGEVNGYTATVEFQKRGLPHLHIVLILAHSERPMSPDQYDDFVSAEIPDKETNPLLYDTVTRCMIHGPCGSKCLTKNPITGRDICSKLS